jgi:hypothetical protein
MQYDICYEIQSRYNEEVFMKKTYNEIADEIKKIKARVKNGTMSSGGGTKLCLIGWLIYNYNLQTTLDLGVYYGKSLFSQAFIHNKYTNGMVYGVDPYTKEDFKQYDPESSPVEVVNNYADTTDFDEIYNYVINSISSFGYEKNITFLRQRSDKAIDYFIENDVYFDLLYIDGNHDTLNAVSDVSLYLPRLKDNGFIIIDDIHFKSVYPAYILIYSLARLCYKETYYAVFQKTKQIDNDLKLLLKDIDNENTANKST